jgi:Sulfotransferase family
MFGSPRTGSTWLLELLAHPLVLEARDPLGFRLPGGRASRGTGRLATLLRSEQPLRPPLLRGRRHWARRRRPRWRRDGWIDVVPINESLLPTHLLPPQLEDPPARDRPWIRTPADIFGELGAYFFSQHYRDVWVPAVSDMARARFGAQFERAAAAYPVRRNAVMVIKEPNGSHAAPLIMSLLPESRLLFLYRDGRDVVDSHLALSEPGQLIAVWSGVALETSRRWGRRSHRRALAEARMELVRQESLNWVARMEATERAFQARPAHLRFSLGYEELLSDPAGRLRELVDWLGLERDSAAIAEAIEANSFAEGGRAPTGAAATRRTASPGVWRENLTDEENALAHEIMGEKLAELGYLQSRARA